MRSKQKRLFVSEMLNRSSGEKTGFTEAAAFGLFTSCLSHKQWMSLDDMFLIWFCFEAQLISTDHTNHQPVSTCYYI